MPMPSRAMKHPDHVWLPWIMSGIVVQANLPNIDSVQMSLQTLSLVLSGYGAHRPALHPINAEAFFRKSRATC